MALACKCDRCGRISFPDHSKRVKRIWVGDCKIFESSCGPVNNEAFDLCENCYNEFLIWFDRPAVYDESNK